MNNYIINRDCRFFRGDIPCRPHKEHGVHCDGCSYFDKINYKILIIKLGALGDVIRTTPLMSRLKKEYENAEITCLTYYLDALPSIIDIKLDFTLQNVLFLLAKDFDLLVNLDKDKEAISLANSIKAKNKIGYCMEDGKCAPINSDAEHKYLTGLFDDISLNNKKSYLEEIFEICGFTFKGEEYILELPENIFSIEHVKSPVIGLNTGCGKRWTTRLWSIENWILLAKSLKEKGFSVVMLGGPDEDAQNKKIALEADVYYPGVFPFKQFANMMDLCDLVVTQVTMALHIAIALKKKIILLNNIFNKNEFELYNLGEIIEPNVHCKGCYKQTCEEECMSKISPDYVYKRIISRM